MTQKIIFIINLYTKEFKYKKRKNSHSLLNEKKL